MSISKKLMNVQALTIALEKKIAKENNQHVEEIRELFHDSIAQIKTERQECTVVQNDELVSVFELLFIALMLDQRTSVLVDRLKKKDPQSYIHSFDVFLLGTAFGAAKGIRDIESLARGCLLHDIGKLDVPDDILMKPGRLTKEEFATIQLHPMNGQTHYRTANAMIHDIITLHHEKQDGSGYPHGLVREEIPLYVQMVSIIDVFSALSLKRPYKEGLDIETCTDKLLQDGDATFNPVLLMDFLQFLEVTQFEDFQHHFEIDVLHNLSVGIQNMLVQIDDN